METAVEGKQEKAPETPPAPPLECTKANKAKKLDYKRSIILFCPFCQSKLVYIDGKGTRIMQSLSMRDGKTILKCKCGKESWTDMRMF